MITNKAKKQVPSFRVPPLYAFFLKCFPLGLLPPKGGSFKSGLFHDPPFPLTPPCWKCINFWVQERPRRSGAAQSCRASSIELLWPSPHKQILHLHVTGDKTSGWLRGHSGLYRLRDLASNNPLNSSFLLCEMELTTLSHLRLLWEVLE